MSKKPYVLINHNIQQAIQDGRKTKWGNEQLNVIIKQADHGMYDISAAINLAIAIKISKPAIPKSGEYNREKDYFTEVVVFADDEVTDENVNKAIDHLIGYECKSPDNSGVPVNPKRVSQL